MASRFRNLYEQETQDALDRVQTAPAQPSAPPVDLAKAQTLARSSNNPQAQQLGSAMLRENDRQQVQASREAERQAKVDSTAAKAAERAQSKAIDDNNARNVRASAAAGMKTTTDIETGKRTVATHPDGAPVFKAGPQGRPQLVGTENTAVQDTTTGQVQATPASNPMIPGDGALGATGGQTKAIFKQEVRDDRGNRSMVDPNATTDAKTGLQTVSKTDATTGQTVKQLVGVDQAAQEKLRKDADLEQRRQEIALRGNAVSQARLRFNPQWEPVKKEFDAASKDLNNYPATFRRNDSGKFDKIDPKTDSAIPYDSRELVVWQKGQQVAKERADQAKLAHDKLLPTAENLNRNETEIKDAHLKLVEEKIRHDSGLPEEDGGAASILAQTSGEVDQSPEQQALHESTIPMVYSPEVLDSAAKSGQSPEPLTKPVISEDTTNPDAVLKAFGGLQNVKGLTLESRPSSTFTPIQKNGRWIGSVEDGGNNQKVITLTDAARQDADINQTVALGVTSGAPVYLRDNGKKKDVAAEASYVSSVYQAMQDPSITSQGQMNARLGLLGATQNEIKAKVDAGELSMQHGESLLKNLYGDTLKPTDPTDPKLRDKWMYDTSRAQQQQSLEETGDRKLDETVMGRWTIAQPGKLGTDSNVRDEINRQYIGEWYASERGKPGVTRQRAQELMAKGSGVDSDIGDKAWQKVRNGGSYALELGTAAVGSTIGMPLGFVDKQVSRVRAWFGDQEADAVKKEYDKLQGRSWSNFNNTNDKNASLYFTDDGQAKQLQFGQALTNIGQTIDSEMDSGKPDTAKIEAAKNQLIQSALAIHNLNPDTDWPVTAESLSFDQDKALGASLQRFIQTADPTELQSMRERLLMSNGQRQLASELDLKLAGMNKFHAAIVGGAYAGYHEQVVELVSDVLTAFTFGASKAVQVGLKAVGAASKATKIGTLTAKVAEGLKTFEEWGLVKGSLAKPLTRLQTVRNSGVKALRGSIDEGLENVATGVGNNDPNLANDFWEGVVGTPFLIPAFHMLGKASAALGDHMNQSRIMRANTVFASKYNVTMAGINGFKPITAEQVGAARNFVDPDSYAASAADITAAREKLVGAGKDSGGLSANIQAEQAALETKLADPATTDAVKAKIQPRLDRIKQRLQTNELKDVTAVKMQLRQVLDDRAGQLATNTENAISAVNEISELPDAKDRTYYSGIAKVATGNEAALTQGERTAIQGGSTPDGAPMFAEVAGPQGVRTVLTDEARAHLRLEMPAVGALVRTTESDAIYDQLGSQSQTPQANGTNPQGPENVQGNQGAQVPVPPLPVGTGGQANSGTGSGGPAVTGTAKAQAQAPELMTATRYEQHIAGNPNAPSGKAVVLAAIKAGKPVSVSMAAAHGLTSAPAGYVQVGPIYEKKVADITRRPTTPEQLDAAEKVADRVIATLKAKTRNVTFTKKRNGYARLSGGIITNTDGSIEFVAQDMVQLMNGHSLADPVAYFSDLAMKHEVMHTAQFGVVSQVTGIAQNSPEFGAAFEAYYAPLYQGVVKSNPEAEAKASSRYGQGAWSSLSDGLKGAEMFRMFGEDLMDGKASEIIEWEALGKNEKSIIQAAIDYLVGLLKGDTLSIEAKKHAVALVKRYSELTGQEISADAKALDAETSVQKDIVKNLGGKVSTSAQTTSTDSQNGAPRDSVTGSTPPGGGTMGSPIETNAAVEASDNLRGATETIRQAILAAREEFPQLKDTDLGYDLEDIAFDMAEPLAEVPAGERKGMVDSAIAVWIEANIAAARAKATGTPDQKAHRKAWRQAAQDKLNAAARAILNSGVHEAFSAVFQRGKITPTPNILGLIRKRKADGKVLTQKEIEIWRNTSEWDGALKKSNYKGGGQTPLARAMIDLIMARQGEGQMPDTIADGLMPKVTTASEMWEQLAKELRTVTTGKNEDRAGFDPMDDPNYEPSDAEIAEWEAKQAKAAPEDQQPHVTLDDAHGFAVQAFGAESPITQKIGAVAEFADRFHREDMPSVRAVVDAEFRRHASGKSLVEADAPALTGSAASFYKFFITNPAETLRKALASLPVVDAGSALFSSPTAAPFYSQLTRTLEEKMPKSATPAQVIQIASSGAKTEEIKWSGLVQATQDLAVDGKVSKDALLKYLADEGSVKFEEVTLGDKPPRWQVSDSNETEYFDTEEEAKDAADEWRSNLAREIEKREIVKVGEGWSVSEGDEGYGESAWLLNDSNDQQKEGFDTEEEANERLEELNGLYAIQPLNDNYWTADPNDSHESEQEAEEARDSEDDAEVEDYVSVQEDDSGNNPNAPLFAEYVLPGGENYREVVLAMPKVSGKESYTSSHFPDVPNYVAHMRLDERTLPDGKRTMHSSEYQSDRHQAGRKEGYSNDQPEWFTLKKGSETNGLFRTREGAEKEAATREGWAVKTIASPQGVADAPFRTSWPLQLFKRHLRDAVAGGFDSVSWDTGATQNDRFDLSKQVDVIYAWPDTDATVSEPVWGIQAEKNGTVEIEKSVKQSELSDLVGKDVAQRIVNREGDVAKHDAEVRELRGENLKVGGSGMRGFYDQILPKEIGKYVKQWNSKLEQGKVDAGHKEDGDDDTMTSRPVSIERGNMGWSMVLEDGTNWGAWSREDAAKNGLKLWQDRFDKRKGTPIWMVKITPEMKRGVAAGQALFSSPSPEFGFNQTTDAGDASQKGFNFDALPPGPNAKFVENTAKAYESARNDKAREEIAKASAAREGITRGKVQNVPQGMIDFGISGSFGTKDQPGLFSSPTEFREISKIAKSLSKPPNQYEYTARAETRPDVTDFLEAFGYEGYNPPADIARKAARSEQITGVSIVFVKGPPTLRLGGNSTLFPRVIYINTKYSHASVGYGITHELIHVAQKDSRIETRSKIADIARLLSASELQEIQRLLVQYGYSLEDMPTVASEIQAFLVADAVMGTNYIGLENLTRKEELRPMLVNFFESLPKLVPDNGPMELFSTGTQSLFSSPSPQPEGTPIPDIPNWNEHQERLKSAETKEMREEINRQYHETHPEAKGLIADRAKRKIPPGWMDVMIFPEGSIVPARGKDSKGRPVSVRTSEADALSAAKKFARAKTVNQAMPQAIKQIGDDLKSGTAPEESSVLRLIYLTGFRNGGDNDTGAKVKAYGASTLRAEHVEIDGDTVKFDFIGKLGVRQQHTIVNGPLAKDLKERKAHGGALFDTNATKVLARWKQVSGNSEFIVHDIRTWNATKLAATIINQNESPTNPTDFWLLRDQIGDIVARKLGDTRSVVLESYIDPIVFAKWRDSASLGHDESRPKISRRDAENRGSSANLGRGTEDYGRSLRDELLPPGSPTSSGTTARRGGGSSGLTQAALFSSPAFREDLFTAATAPDATQQLGSVKVGTMNALGAYRALTAKRDAGKALTGKEEDQLLQAETALGQKLAFDMESVKGDAPAVTEQSSITARPEFGQNRRAGQDEMSRAGEIDRSGQISLFSSPSLKESLVKSFSETPNQYTYEPSTDISPEIRDISTIIRDAYPKFRIVVPHGANAQTKRLEERTGAAIAFFKGFKEEVHGFTPRSSQSLIFINAENGIVPTSWSIAHELTHIIQKRGKHEGILSGILERLTEPEFERVRTALLEEGYAESDLADEIPAFFMGDAVSGYNSIGLQHYNQSDAIREFLQGRFEEFERPPSVGLASSPLPAASKITAAQDAEYLELAKDPEGNREELQEMVDQAARSKGYNVRAKHGTAGEFTAFDPKLGGKMTDALSAKSAFFFTNDDKTAMSYAVYAAEDGPVRESLAKAEKAERMGDWDGYDRYTREAEELDTYDGRMERRKNANIIDAYIAGDFLEFDAEGKTPQELHEDLDTGITNEIKSAKRQGKTGVVYYNLDDAINLANRPATHYAVFKPSQIKTAAAVTFDEVGKPIPLSERFNPASDSILYSSPTPADQIDWKKFPPVFRSVYAAVLEGKSSPQIAREMRISEKAVGNILNQIGVRAQALDEAANGGLTPTMRDGLLERGRPERAMSGSSPEVARILQIREDAGDPETIANAETYANAKKMIAEDYQGTIERITARRANGEDLTLNEVAAAQMILLGKVGKKRSAMSKAEKLQLGWLAMDWVEQGTDDARRLQIRRDVTHSPAERAALYFAKELYTPQDAATVKALKDAKGRKAKEEVMKRFIERSEGLKERLKARGIDLEASLEEFRRQQDEKQAMEEAVKQAHDRLTGGYQDKVAELQDQLAKANEATEAAQAVGFASEAQIAAMKADAEAMADKLKKARAELSKARMLEPGLVLRTALLDLSDAEKAAMETLLNGGTIENALAVGGMSQELLKKVYTDFTKVLVNAQREAARMAKERMLEMPPVLMSSAMESEINRSLGVVPWDELEARKAPVTPEQARQKPKKTPKPKAEPLVFTPEQQAAIDAAFERFKNADPSTWNTLFETESKNLTPIIGQVGFDEFKGKALQPWKDRWQTEMDGIANPAARISFEEWIAKPSTRETAKRERDLFPQPINEETGTWNDTRPFTSQGELIREEISTTTGLLDFNDPLSVRDALREISTGRSSTMDRVMEYWRAAILSGPQTAIVNTTSNLAFGTFNAIPRRMVESAVNATLKLVGLGSNEDASFGEFTAMAKHLRGAASLAARKAVESWNQESANFKAYALATENQLNFGGKDWEDFQPALPGKFGAFMRSISFRHMQAADEFGKFFFGQIEVAAQAYRIAKAEGLTSNAREARISELIEQKGSEAWKRTYDIMLKNTFQEKLVPLGEATSAIRVFDTMALKAKDLRAMPYLGRPITFFLPFIMTPTNIAKQAVEISPLGGVLALIDGSRALKRRLSAGKLNADGMRISKEEAKLAADELYDKARFVRDLTNQVVAWSIYFTLASMVGGDDDDDLPLITGTMAYTLTKRGERDVADRVMPPQSIRIPGTNTFMSYSRMDPFATVMAGMVDMTRSINKEGGFNSKVATDFLVHTKNAMKDKTFLTGVSNLINALEDPSRVMERLSAGIITGFIPNLIRQPIRETDTVKRDMNPREDDGFAESIAKRLGYAIVPQSAPPKIDVWGNDLPAHNGEMIGGHPVANAIFRTLDPTNLTVGNKIDPLDLYIFKWNNAAQDSDKIGIMPLPDYVTGTVDGKSTKLPLTVAEQTEANRRVGQQAHELLLGRGLDHEKPSKEGAEIITETFRQLQTMERANIRNRKLVERQSVK